MDPMHEGSNMIRATARVTNPDSTEITIELTMTAAKWTTIRNVLSRAPYPCGHLSEAISKSLRAILAQVTDEHGSET